MEKNLKQHDSSGGKKIRNGAEFATSSKWAAFPLRPLYSHSSHTN